AAPMTVYTQPPAPFGAPLRRHREAAWLTQEALVERAHVSALERGVNRLTTSLRGALWRSPSSAPRAGGRVDPGMAVVACVARGCPRVWGACRRRPHRAWTGTCLPPRQREQPRRWAKYPAT